MKLRTIVKRARTPEFIKFREYVRNQSGGYPNIILYKEYLSATSYSPEGGIFDIPEEKYVWFKMMFS